jgi:hypothetical protein
MEDMQLFTDISQSTQAITSEAVIDAMKENIVAISYINKGTATARVNGFPLAPGDPMLTYEYDERQRDVSKHTVTFVGTGSKLVYAIKITKVRQYLESVKRKKC